jgi:DHA2 family multidrug resistance protein
MINLMRNVGGSVGIAAVTTLLVRRQQIHQNVLVQHTFEFNPQLQRMRSDLTHHNSIAGGRGTGQTRGVWTGDYHARAAGAVLAYIDAFQMMGIV